MTPDTALALARRAVELAPDSAAARHALANALKSAGQLAEAIDAYHMAIAINPNFSEAWGNLGLAFHEAHNLPSAIFAFNALLKLTPNDPLAHNALANALRDQGHYQAALDSYHRALALRPNYAIAHNNLGKLLHDLGRLPQAIEHYHLAIAADPNRSEPYQNLGIAFEKLGQTQQAIDMYRKALARGVTAPEARYHMAALIGSDAPDAAPTAHILQLFNPFAETFDDRLSKLHYQTPQLLLNALLAATGHMNSDPALRGDGAPHGNAGPWLTPASLDIIDLGCGTGLCAPLLKPFAKTLLGVDLSPNMIEKARQRNLYTSLITADLLPTLHAHPNFFDLAIAADVLVYFGDLAPLFTATHAALRPNALFAFSVESSPDDTDFALRPTRRYTHSEPYLRRLAAHHHFQILSLTPGTLREESAHPVPGLIAILRKK
ncbi:MAG: tetratricopeptide repeat protein [Phycisphaerales bacterium]|nr:tetratricopeptide repeat protein [Phycisphaerales bacterium]